MINFVTQFQPWNDAGSSGTGCVGLRFNGRVDTVSTELKPEEEDEVSSTVKRADLLTLLHSGREGEIHLINTLSIFTSVYIESYRANKNLKNLLENQLENDRQNK